jgi:hypothetical protein
MIQGAKYYTFININIDAILFESCFQKGNRVEEKLVPFVGSFVALSGDFVALCTFLDDFMPSSD